MLKNRIINFIFALGLCFFIGIASGFLRFYFDYDYHVGWWSGWLCCFAFERIFWKSYDKRARNGHH